MRHHKEIHSKYVERRKLDMALGSSQAEIGRAQVQCGILKEKIYSKEQTYILYIIFFSPYLSLLLFIIDEQFFMTMQPSDHSRIHRLTGEEQDVC